MALTSEELSTLILLAEDSQDEKDSAYSLEALAEAFLAKIRYEIFLSSFSIFDIIF